MPPRIHLPRACRSLSIRSRPLIVRRRPALSYMAPCRGFANEKDPKPMTELNQDVLGHVSEEAADIGKIMGETLPDLSQGTPVQEVLERDQESKEKAPEVVKKETQVTKDEPVDLTFETLLAMGEMTAAEETALTERYPDAPGHIFGLPTLPLPSNLNLKHRYDPAVDQFTKLIMKHGKLSAAQRHMSMILNHLRTAPPPTPNPARPLLPGAPPPAHLPLNPVLYLTLAIDSVAPLLRIRSQKGAAGGGTALQIPVPLGLRQRRRAAVMWILDAVAKKPSRGSGRAQFPQRVAEELISVVEGRSSAWDKRHIVHKTATVARVNLKFGQRRR